MRWIVVLGVAMLAGILFLSGTPAQADDKVIGAVWEFTIKGKTPKDDIVRRLRATPRGKVWSVLPPRSPGTPEIIGSWSSNGPKITMVIEQTATARRPRVNGTYEIVQIGKNPPNYRGKFINEQKEESAVQVKLIRD